MDEEQPLSADAFLRKVESKRAVALATVGDRLACNEAWLASGFAVEFAIKALIMRKERLNAWPSKEARPDLYTHDLARLFQIAGMDLKTARKPLRGAIRTALDWNRAHEYTSGRMSQANARSMVAAVFGDEGVITWLNNQ